jgi:hypothetical protein
MKCPVCDKPGLPNYKVSPAICPQCNSDLGGFDQIEKTRITFNNIRKQRLSLLIISVVVICILVGSYFIHPIRKTTKEFQQEIYKADSLLTSLNIEIANKDLEIQKLSKDGSKPEIISIPYVVKKDDNLSEIAYFFYGNWEMFLRIQQDNDLKPDQLLMPKDTLIINIDLK